VSRPKSSPVKGRVSRVPTQKAGKSGPDGHTCGEIGNLNLPGTAVNTPEKQGRAASVPHGIAR
jgi:hypothetical protein